MAMGSHDQRKEMEAGLKLEINLERLLRVPIPKLRDFLNENINRKEQAFEGSEIGSSSKGKRKAPEVYYCDWCGVSCNSAQVLQNHWKGKKHKKAVKAACGGGG